MTRTSISQPGPPASDRAVLVPVGAVPINATLPAGLKLLDALAALMDAWGVESACLTLSGGAFGPFAYVIPSLPPDASHAAFYSETRLPPGASVLDTAAVTLGVRDGRPFFHCHALWTEADGSPGCGHVLPDDTMIAAPIHAGGAGIVGARFEVHPDVETGFSLFRPVATGTLPLLNARPAIAMRLAPNQDLTSALEAAGRTAGFRHARLHGGVASIIGAQFTDAPAVLGYATEMAVRHGLIDCEGGVGTALDVVIVDYTGTIGAGRLVNGANAVLMTFEGLLEAE